MKIGKCHTQWLAFISGLYTANTCGKAIVMRLFGKINRPWVDTTIHRWADRILDLVDVTCKVVNPDQVTPQLGEATIIMCNHSSLYDIPLSFKVFPHTSIRMLAKKELFNIPIMGKGMQAAEFPFIDRKNRAEAIKNLEYMRQLMESGVVVWVAPEGTRSKDGKLAPFKKGAFVTAIESKAMIIPIGIRGANNILPARTMQFNLNQTAEIHVGQPIDASRYTMENRDELIDLVHQTIKQLVEGPQ